MKRMKFFLLALALIFVLSAAFGCAKKEDKTFTVGFDADFPPYGYIDENGEYIGFDLDLAAEVCARRGWALKLSPIDWNSKDFELESGAIDCIWNGFTMNGREEFYTWTDAYMDNSQVFVTRAADGLSTFADLAGKVVTVQADSSCEAALNDEENPDAIALRESKAFRVPREMLANLVFKVRRAKRAMLVLRVPQVLTARMAYLSLMNG